MRTLILSINHLLHHLMVHHSPLPPPGSRRTGGRVGVNDSDSAPPTSSPHHQSVSVVDSGIPRDRPSSTIFILRVVKLKLRRFLLKRDVPVLHVPPGIPMAFFDDPSLLNFCLFSRNPTSHPSDIKKCAATPRSKNLNCDHVMRRVRINGNIR
jgi:hypothetical protein